jgi:hypothetical protein
MLPKSRISSKPRCPKTCLLKSTGPFLVLQSAVQSCSVAGAKEKGKEEGKGRESPMLNGKLSSRTSARLFQKKQSERFLEFLRWICLVMSGECLSYLSYSDHLRRRVRLLQPLSLSLKHLPLLPFLGRSKTRLREINRDCRSARHHEVAY